MHNSFRKIGWIMAFGFFSIGQSISAQTIYFVNASTEPGGDGLSWETAFSDIQQALDTACMQAPAQIWVAAGTYFPSQNVDHTSTGPTDRSNTFSLCNNVSLYGGFVGNEVQLSERDWIINKTVLSGDIDQEDTLTLNAYTVLTIVNTDSTSILDGFTISEGYAEIDSSDILAQNAGGGIYLVNSNLSIRNCEFTNNAAISGGGVCVIGGSPRMTNCRISNNKALGMFGRGAGIFIFNQSEAVFHECIFERNDAPNYGGAIYGYDTSSVTLVNCMIKENASKRGGGIYTSFSSSLYLNETIITHNTVEQDGGGIYTNGNLATVITNCTINDNNAVDNGGAMFNAGASIIMLKDCRVIGNKGYNGGGLYNNSSVECVIVNTFLSSNEAEGDGGGMFNFRGLSTLTNCVISGNLSGGDGGGIYNGETYSKLINCSVTGNAAFSDGGGIYNDSGTDPFITNCILWNNMAGGVISTASSTIYNRNNSNANISYSLLQNSGGSSNWDTSLGTDHGENIDQDPLFTEEVDIQNLPNATGNFNLLLFSPVINTGTLDTTKLDQPVKDAGGDPRLVHGRIDMGAFEFQGENTLPDCIITGPDQVSSFSNDLFSGPDGMVTYAWNIEGNGHIIGPNDQQLVNVVAGVVNTYLLTLKVVDIDLQSSTCALKKSIEVDCGIYDTTQVIYVNAASSGANTGANWEDAFTNLQDALQINCLGTKAIWVAGGNYFPTRIPHDRSSYFQLENGQAIYGGFAGDELILAERDFVNNESILNGDIEQDGVIEGNSFNVVNGSYTDSSAILDGFTISGGNAEIFGGSYKLKSSGGGIFIQYGEPTIANCIITGNTAYLGAGCMNYNASPTMTNCTFSLNTTGMGGRGGGIFNADNAAPVLTDCTFSFNSGTLNGGGMSNLNASPILVNCTFNQNEVTSNSGRGGGIMNVGSSPSLSMCTFSGNKVAGNGLGGGMNNQSVSSPSLKQCSFSENVAKGGAGMCNQNESSPVLLSCTFMNNETRFEGFGGGMYNQNKSNPVLTYCFFAENFGYNYGGGMYNDASAPTLSNCIFSRNESFEYGGGGMANNNSSPSIASCAFLENMSYLYGGGMYNTEGSAPNITGCVFKMDTAGLGGAMANSENSSPNIYHCIFESNNARFGGGMDNSVYASPLLTNCTFRNNTADDTGGGLNNSRSASPILTNCILIGNSSIENGGGMYNEFYAYPQLTNCTISGNSSDGDGGGIFNVENALVLITNSIIWNNRANGNTTTVSASVSNDTSSITSVFHSLVASSGGSQNWNNDIGFDLGNNLDSDPLFVQDIDFSMFPDISGDVHLLMSSPAINAGSPDTAGLHLPVVDADGNPRFFNGRIDMGPYEYQGIVSVMPDAQSFVSLDIHPNPASDILYVMSSEKDGDIVITDAAGHFVSKYTNVEFGPKGMYKLDISHLEPGWYTLLFNCSNGPGVVAKFVVVR